MNLLFRYFLEFIVVMFAAVYAYIPVRKNLRFSAAATCITSASVLVVFCIIGAYVCSRYGISSNRIIIPALPVFLLLYILVVRMPVSEKFFCFFTATMLSGFCTMYTHYVGATFELSNSDLPFTLNSSAICIGMNLVFILVFFRPLFVWIPGMFREDFLDGVWNKVFILPLAMTVFFLWITPLKASNVVVARTQIIGIVLITFFPLIIWGMFYISWRMLQRYKKYTEIRGEKELLVIEKKRYERFMDYHEKTKRIRHDFRQYILLLKKYADEGDLDSLKKKVESIHESLPDTPEKVCAQPAIDAVCGYYKEIAAANNIAVSFIISLPHELPFDDMDLCSIFGNLLENAVRECEKAPVEDRRLTVVSKMISDEMMGISIENTYIGEIRIDAVSGLPVSGKTAHGIGRTGYGNGVSSGHGIGLISVRTIVERLGGNMIVSAEKGVFTVNILI